MVEGKQRPLIKRRRVLLYIPHNLSGLLPLGLHLDPPLVTVIKHICY